MKAFSTIKKKLNPAPQKKIGSPKLFSSLRVGHNLVKKNYLPSKSFALSPKAPSLAKRHFSSPYNHPSFKASDLQITKTTSFKPKPPLKELVFGKTLTDHMLEIDWDVEKGWDKPRISPYRKLEIDPSATVLHYGIELFEGMKAYKDKKGSLRLFRPDKNMERMNRSAARIALPNFDGEELTKTISEFVKLESDWVSDQFGYSLYLRPTMIGTAPGLGVSASTQAKLFVIASPVGPYYPTGWKPVNLYATTEYVRAWPGGTGNSKLGANYCSGILPTLEVAKQGYQQLLWLQPPNDHITEVGTMNMLVYWLNESGEKELRTAPLDGTILPGVTRDSILSLGREWGEFKVAEQPWTIQDLKKALNENRVLEAFGAGTAAIVSSVKSIYYKGDVLQIPIDKNDPEAGVGPLAKRYADHLMGIQYGEIPHPWSVEIK